MPCSRTSCAMVRSLEEPEPALVRRFCRQKPMPLAARFAESSPDGGCSFLERGRYFLQAGAGTPSPFVFTSMRKGPFSTAGFARMLEPAGIAAGLAFQAHPHMLRHASRDYCRRLHRPTGAHALMTRVNSTRGKGPGSAKKPGPPTSVCG